MSRAFLFVAALVFLGVGVTRLILGQWIPELWYPMGLSLILLFGIVVVDFRFFLDFFTMRTTKHGMNMGVMILLCVGLLVAVNFIAVKKDKRFDWTVEKLNSLSDQSIKAAQVFAEPVEITYLYQTNKTGEQDARQVVQDLASMYTAINEKISYKAFNARTNPALAEKFSYKQGDAGLYAVKGDKHVSIDKADEEAMTKALLKLNRNVNKSIYFVTGHGERDIEGSNPEGISAQGGMAWRQDLDDLYQVKSINLADGKGIPADAAVVAIIGPQSGYSDLEMASLRNYARKGGKFLIALDPEFQHGMANLTKFFGIEYKNQYILDPRRPIQGADERAVLGTEFSKNQDATKSIGQAGAVFWGASPLQKAPDSAPGIAIDYLVKSGQVAVVNSLKNATGTMQAVEPQTIGMVSSGKIPASAAPTASAKIKIAGDAQKVFDEEAELQKSEGKDFQAIVYGDSDFLSAKLYGGGVNRDLAMNSVAALAQDNEMISIRPKMPASTNLQLTPNQLLILLIGVCVPIPLLMFFGGAIVWWRRRTA